MNTFRHFGWAP